jgi:predicted metal-dependent phosphoesterase TrpH
MNKIDLHLHTNKSDGRLTPTELVRLVHKGGVRRMALTDHDTTAGVEEAMAEGKTLGVEVIPGVELGTDSRSGDLHMLGLFLDYHDQQFQETMARFRDGRIARVHKIVSNLAEVGVNISVDRVFAIAGEASVGRPHVAQALLEAGYITSMPEAFEKWLAHGGPGAGGRHRADPRRGRAGGGGPPLRGEERPGSVARPCGGWAGRRGDVLPELWARSKGRAPGALLEARSAPDGWHRLPRVPASDGLGWRTDH